VATCAGTGYPQTVSFPTQTDQYVEVVLTAPTPTYWWSVEAFNVYSNGQSSTGEGPYGGTPAAIPGTIQAANYDTGGQGTGYEVSAVNGTANSYRADGVDLEACADTGGGYDVGWTAAGQWFRYTVDVASAGTYTVSLRLASPSGVTDALHLANSAGTNISGDVTVPATGGWQDWTTVSASVTLPAGQQVLTLDQDNGGWKIHQLTFAPATASPVTVTASQYTSQNSTGTETTSDTGGGQDVGWINSSSWLEYTGINFGTGLTGTVAARIASNLTGTGIGTIQFRLDSLTAPPFATITVNGTGGWQDWTTAVSTA